MFFTSFFCCLFMFFLHIFFLTSYLTLWWAITRFIPILYLQPSPPQKDSQHFHLRPFRDLLLASTTVSTFYPQVFFTLRSFTNIFDLTCIYQCFPWSRQFFFEVCRASHWGLNHRTDPARLFVWITQCSAKVKSL